MSRNIWKSWYKRIPGTALIVVMLALLIPLGIVLIVPVLIFCAMAWVIEWSVKTLKTVPHCKWDGKCEDCDLQYNARYDQRDDEEQCEDYVLDEKND